MKLLDLFCKAGGAGYGYHLAGFDVVGVDIEPQPNYPFEFHQSDALEFLELHGSEYCAIHASPPCQRYSHYTEKRYRSNHPDLIEPVRELLMKTGKPFVIENVNGARFMLKNPIMLCGSMFGLKVWRHRWFEINPNLSVLTPTCNHSFAPVVVTGSPRRGGNRREPSTQERRDAMGTQWMNRLEMDEAIPPAYTKYIGGLLLANTALLSNTASTRLGKWLR